MREGLCPRVDVVRIAKDVIPDGVFERRQFPLRSLRDVAESVDARLEDVVESEGEKAWLGDEWLGCLT